jgi:hypothetical protein
MRRSGFARVWSRPVFELGGRAVSENDNHKKGRARRTIQVGIHDAESTSIFICKDLSSGVSPKVQIEIPIFGVRRSCLYCCLDNTLYFFS